MKEIVSFYLSGKMYGVDVDHMQGIEKHRELARPTGLPDFMEGVADIRGELRDGILKIRIPKKEAVPAVEEKKYITIEG